MGIWQRIKEFFSITPELKEEEKQNNKEE